MSSVDLYYPGPDGCLVTFQCDNPADYGKGVTGADLINAYVSSTLPQVPSNLTEHTSGSAIQAAGCAYCGLHRLSKPGCTLSFTYCEGDECQDTLAAKVRRQAGSDSSGSSDAMDCDRESFCESDYVTESDDEDVGFDMEPDPEFATRGTGEFRAISETPLLPMQSTRGKALVLKV